MDELTAVQTRQVDVQAVARRAVAQLLCASWAYLAKPTPAQRGVLEHPARFKVLACGRRFGKTALAVHHVGQQALRTSKRYGYFAPTYKLLQDAWREMKRALGTLVVEKNETEKRLVVVGGGTIECWSLQDEASARGRKYAGLVVDEAAFVPNLEGAWNAALRPTLSDERGWAWFLSTPRGRNFFWKLYRRGVSGEAGWQAWHFPTAANPHIPAEELEAAREDTPFRFYRQEYLAEFIEDAGAVFRRVMDAVVQDVESEPVAEHEYVFGVDWARDNDFTAIAVLNATSGRLVALERFNQVGWSLQRGRLIAMYEHWKPSVIWAEENSIGSPNIEALQQEGLPVQPFQTTASTKPQLIEALALAFERGELGIVNDHVLIGELQAYAMKRLPSGRFQYSAPGGEHDDTVIALALAWWGKLNRTRLDIFWA